MLDGIKEFFASKKAIAFFAGLIFVVLQPVAERFGFPVTEGHLVYVVSLVVGYLGGQGLADLGKERARIELEDEGEG